VALLYKKGDNGMKGAGEFTEAKMTIIIPK
jgi:hypothetical protein